MLISEQMQLVRFFRLLVMTSIVLIICLFTEPILQTVLAKEAKIKNMVLSNTRDNVVLYLNVDGAFRENIEKAILSGVSASFSFIILLNKVSSIWKDKTLLDIRITHTIKYNNLKKEFTVTRSWGDGRPIVTNSFEEAQRLMID
ncbi:MAG: DUF4390 domain-containing protein, partial [Desulfobacterales bacterium]|nr:DUF4390 domain-containing protein [Desulfobacterales bacterium]